MKSGSFEAFCGSMVLKVSVANKDRQTAAELEQPRPMNTVLFNVNSGGQHPRGVRNRPPHRRIRHAPDFFNGYAEQIKTLRRNGFEKNEAMNRSDERNLKLIAYNL